LAKRKLITKKQLEKIQSAIRQSKDATDYGKKVIIWFFEQMYNVQVPLVLNFFPRYHKKGQQAAYAAHDMKSFNGTTHLGTHIKKLGLKLYLQSCEGYYEDEILKRSSPCGYIIWISESLERPKAIIKPNFQQITRIKLF